MDRILDGFESEIAGGAGFGAAAGEPYGEAVMVMIAVIDLAGIGAGLKKLDDKASQDDRPLGFA